MTLSFAPRKTVRSFGKALYKAEQKAATQIPAAIVQVPVYSISGNGMVLTRAEMENQETGGFEP